MKRVRWRFQFSTPGLRDPGRPKLFRYFTLRPSSAAPKACKEEQAARLDTDKNTLVRMNWYQDMQYMRSIRIKK